MIKETKRKDMKHFHDMNDACFIELLNQSKGTIGNLKTVMKVDGISARFGKDKNGNIFFEGARTGPIFEKNSFSNYAKARGFDIERATHYDDLLNIFQETNLLDQMPNDTKIICEILYTPLANKIDNESITFISIPYQKSLIGEVLTILPFYATVASSGQEIDNFDFNFLYKQNNSKIKTIDPNLNMGVIDIHKFCDKLNEVENKEVLFSKKRNDREIKELTKTEIKKIKTDLGYYILSSDSIVGKERIGEVIEGIVVWVNNKEYKITTQQFKNLKVKL